MKTRLIRKTRQFGSALLVTLVICSILSIFVMYYLSLIDQQSYLNARSQSWNMAIAISEAGIEEGMAQLNMSYPDMNTDGWTYNGSSYYWKSNTLPGGNAYVAYIIVTNSYNPMVVARAFVNMPAKYGQNTSSTLLAAIGSGGFSSPTGGALVSRAVQVTTSKKSLFQVAMVAKRNIDLNGKGIVTDSYNSSLPGIASSLTGQYDPSKAGSKGDVATNLGVIDSINGGNAQIYGHAHTGPASQSTALQIGSSGYVGNKNDQAAVGAGNVESGWWLPDSNFTFPDTSYPNTTGYLPPQSSGYVMMVTNWSVSYVSNVLTMPNPMPPGGVTTVCGAWQSSGNWPIIPCCTIVTNNNNGVKSYQYQPIAGYSYNFSQSYSQTVTNYYDNILYGSGAASLTGLGTLSNPYVFTPGTSGATNYFVASSLSGNTVVLGTNVVLAMPNGINMSGNDSFTVAPGANVVVYSGGNSASIGGNGIINETGFAANFVVYAAPTVTKFAFNGNGTFTGILVAPNADIAMNGSGSNPQDFCGCVIANSVTMNGNYKFHYDEALAGNNKDGRFLITAWNEVK